MDVTATSQAFGSAVSAVDAMGHLNLMQTLMYLLGGLAVILGSAGFTQHALEIIYAYVKPPFWMKAFIPMVWSGVVGWMLKSSGLDAASAGMAAVTLHQLVDKLNDSPWAKSIEDKVMTAVQSKVAAAVLILGLLALGAGLKADTPVASVGGWCAGPSLWAGASLYQTAPGGLVPVESALAGAQFAGYLGSWQGNTFTPAWTLGALVALDTIGGGNYPAAGLQGGWYLGGAPVTGFIAWRLDNQSPGAMVGIGTSVQFQGYVPFLYLGHPGN